MKVWPHCFKRYVVPAVYVLVKREGKRLSARKTAAAEEAHQPGE